MLLELETRATPLTPKSINDADRTAEIVISTGAGVRRYDRDEGSAYVEVLDLAGIDASRTYIPLLDSHRQDSLDRVLGRVIGVRREGESIVAKVRFAKTPSGEIAFQAVKDGDFSSASVGYAPTRHEDRLDRQTGERVRMILGWTLHEVSIVPVPADAGAQIRSDRMSETAIASAAPAPKTIVPEDAGGALQTRAETNREIRALAETFGLGADFANTHIDAETAIAEVRQAALQALQTRAVKAPSTITVTAVHDASPEETARRMGEAVFARSVPAHKVSDPARPYMNMTTLDMARACLQSRSISTIGLSPSDTITRALHTTSDFPAIFAQTANRSLRRAYDIAPQVLKRLGRQTTARDFRAKTGIQLGEAPTLEKVNEAGEYKYGTLAEASESYRIDTYGKIVSLSRKAIINDDLGAFVDLTGRLGMAAAEFEAQFLANLLATGASLGPTMADTKTLFHTDHGNKSATGAALDATTLGAARLAMRRQKGLAGRPINVTPTFVLIPPKLETAAEQILAAIQPTKSADVNPFGGKLELLVEARLASAARWYVVADPAQIDGLEYAYLQGEEGPQTETRAGFEVDGIEVKVRLDFGAAFLDWRGWYTNAGV